MISSADGRVLHRSGDVEEAPLSGDLMLFHPGTSKFFVLNKTMGFIWHRCDGQHTVAAMVHELMTEFTEAERSLAEADVNKAVEELIAHGLVVAKMEPSRGGQLR